MDVKERLMKFIAHKGLTNSDFERISGLSNSYVSKIRTSVGKLGSMNIQRAFPELNMNWLLTGEGEMLKSGVTQTANGDNNMQIAGDGNLINAPSTVDKVLEEFAEQRKFMEKAQGEIAEQRKLVAKSQEQVSKTQEQIDRLITLIEKMQNI